MGVSGRVFVPLAAGIGHRQQTEHRSDCGQKYTLLECDG